jgi:hypothetical protein
MGELSRPRTGLWMVAAFAAALIVALGVLLVKGTGESGVGVGLRLTARVAYLFFWPAYVGGAAATLFGAPFKAVARRTRELSLAFASALLVHVALVIWAALISPPQPLTNAVMPFFAIGVLWAYLLAGTSVDFVQTKLDSYFLRAFRTIGVEYIALTFFTDFVILANHPLKYPLLYIPFWAMLGLGPLLRLAAAMRQLLPGPVSVA